MSAKIEAVVASDCPVLAALLDDYLAEYAAQVGQPAGPTRASEYPYLDAYFGEPGRHGFLIIGHGQAVGFVLIRGPKSNGGRWQVAEFYVVPAKRRGGLGRAAIGRVWQQFPGHWELEVHTRNESGRRFWDSMISAMAPVRPVVQVIDAEDGQRHRYLFTTS